MNKIRLFLFGLFSLGLMQVAFAHVGPGTKKANTKRTVQFRGGDCAPATRQIDQEINNVRARLLNGGDVWWDTDDGRYIVPKVPPGQPEVSSLFAGAVWIGGIDPGGSLKLAAKAYGSSRGQTDFFPGPLDQFAGTTNRETCTNWDKFFKVLASEIDEHLALIKRAEKGEIDYTDEMIPSGVKGWPAKDNPYFLDVWGFELPSTGQGLAGYFDAEPQNGVYDPLDGDFPVIEIIGCTDYSQEGITPQYPDEMIFWIYNDAGGIHTESTADAIQMEIQVQTFAYATNDAINNMTFQRYKLINRATEDIRDCYFAMWADPDLGCYTDDYIGCDTVRSLMYVYNQDAVDGQTGSTCPGGVNTYGSEVPILGIDYFRGPQGESDIPCRDSLGEIKIDSLTSDTIFETVELGMSSFTYYNNPQVGTWPGGTTDPQTAEEYYNYITGRWRDGSSYQLGGSGYQTQGADVNYAFVDDPSCTSPDCWSMCTAGLGEGDRRTLQATGPFKLKPGDVNELIVGVVWLPEQSYPCPKIDKLQDADDIAQSLFNNCFDITDGPDAPDVDWLELDREIVGILTNDRETSNNAFERYEEVDLKAPDGVAEEAKTYRFEGYKVFQLINGSVSVTELGDPTKAALVYQSDVDNEVGLIYNWEAEENPNPGQADIWVPVEKVEASNPNGGIRHTFKLTEDLFTESTDTRLINHKKYFYMAIAYAHNEYERFDPFASAGTGEGQNVPYLEGRRNIEIYTVIPRPQVYEVLSAEYGEGVEITRLDGVGAGSNFLDPTLESREAMLSPDFNGSITYKEGRGPFDVTIFNPLNVVDGEFELTLVDDNLNNSNLDKPGVTWRLTNLNNPADVIESDQGIEGLNEQIIPQFGFSISMKDGLLPGNFRDQDPEGDPSNGAIGYEEEYLDPLGNDWFTGIPDGFSPEGVAAPPDWFNYILTGPNEADFEFDPTQTLSSLGTGIFAPYFLNDYRVSNRAIPFVSPAWTQQGGLVRAQMSLEDLNNVDIIFTKDKSKWSRCIIVESSSPQLTQFGFTTEGTRNHFDLRGAPSVGKEDADGDGLPDPDGDGEGMGWFPGYAVDVETGQRLNIYFGEASIYRCDEPFFNEFLNACGTGIFDDNAPTGADMMWNPTSQGGLLSVPSDFITPDAVWIAITGAQHFIYVTKQPYDGCITLRDQLKPGVNPLFKARAFQDVTWSGYPMLLPGASLNSYADGLIPNDLIVKLRVDDPFEVQEGNDEINDTDYPTYRFSISGKEARAVDSVEEKDNALDNINIVPNPYYGFSPYETSQFATTVKMTNLPAKCIVSIYTLDGKFIRQYNRDETGATVEGIDRALEQGQINPDLEWDLRNGKGIPVASGVYLIHVDAPGFGERVLKWFGIARQYDPSGL